MALSPRWIFADIIRESFLIAFRSVNGASTKSRRKSAKSSSV